MRVLHGSLFAGLIVMLASCTIQDTVVASGVNQVVVHAVLDPSSATQEILVERTLTGSINIVSNIRFDPLDPINTGEGIPVAGAAVNINGPDGALPGLEIKYPNKVSTYGAGRYIVSTLGTRAIKPGAVYTLSIRTLDGLVVTGKTIVPNSIPAIIATAAPVFDRDRDTLRLNWPSIPAARTYGLRVESPFGAFLLFTDSTSLKLPGTLTNLFASDLQRVFIAGFIQTAVVFASDTNYFDYYRSRNDPFTGSGIINHLDGGIGLFGAVVPVAYRTVDVTQQTKEPLFEGTWQVVRIGIARPVVDNFKLYLEKTSTASSSLSGTYIRDATLPVRAGMIGARDGARVELQFLTDEDSRQTYARFVGVQMADSLVGTYTNSTTRTVFRKRP